MRYYDDWVEVNDGTSTQRYCGFPNPYDDFCSSSCDYCARGHGYTPSPVTGTTITVKLQTSDANTASGFFAVVTGDATVTTDVTGESEFGKCK